VLLLLLPACCLLPAATATYRENSNYGSANLLKSRGSWTNQTSKFASARFASAAAMMAAKGSKAAIDPKLCCCWGELSMSDAIMPIMRAYPS